MNNIRLGLAALSLLPVLTAPQALAADRPQAERQPCASCEVARTHRVHVRQANQAAAEEAAAAVLAAVKLDLDIRLIGNTSMTVAARD